MAALILTGPSAAGKAAVAVAASKLVDRCALVDVDLVRQRFGVPLPQAAIYELAAQGRWPLPLPESVRPDDWAVGVRASIAVAKAFMAGDYQVILHDILTEASTRIYREELPEARIVLLRPTLEAVQQRWRQRAAIERFQRLQETEVVALYQHQAAYTGQDEVIDNTELTIPTLAAQLAVMLSG